MKKLRYLAEAALLYVLMFVFRIMSVDLASDCGGWLGRTIGPRLAASRKAIRQVEEHLPDADAEDVIRGMWENLGRIIAEYPHLKQIGRERVTIENPEIIKGYLNVGQPCMFFSAHMGNWEVPPPALLMQTGKAVDITYRPPNNPWVDKALLKMRNMDGRINAHPKSREGAVQMLTALKQSRMMCFLIDQKYNEGVAVPFFGKPAMTNPAFVIMARKYNYPLIPIQIIRENGANFRIIIHEELKAPKDRPVEEVIAQAHGLLEDWIAKRPAQWLWLHRRWESLKLEEKD